MRQDSHRYLVSSCVVALFLAGNPLAEAQGPAATSPTVAVTAVAGDMVARRLFLAGREAFVRGDFEEAEHLWERAFALSGRAALLLNLAVVRQRLGRPKAAARALRDYLWLQPRDERRAELRARIERLERQAGLARGVSWRGWPMWSAAGASVALGAGAALMQVLAEQRFAELAASCGRQPGGCPEEDIASVEGRVTWARVLLGLAAASAATAVTFWVIGGKDESERPAEALEVRP